MTLEAASCSHAGLALSRLIKPGVTAENLTPVATIRCSPDYERAYKRWEAIELPGTEQATVATAGALLIGSGNFSPAENGLTLHHTWGVPYIPGPALKNLARRAALELKLGLTQEEMDIMFGTSSEQGYVFFDDAWMKPPDSLRTPILALDGMTPHVGPYYASQGQKPPDDFHDPTPISFLTVAQGTKFRLGLECPSDLDWAKATMAVLLHGLLELGLGAKTNAGYGYFATTS